MMHGLAQERGALERVRHTNNPDPPGSISADKMMYALNASLRAGAEASSQGAFKNHKDCLRTVLNSTSNSDRSQPGSLEGEAPSPHREQM